MFRKMLLAKIHGATVTAADLNYEGSLTLPPELLAATGVLPYESLHVWNVTRGTRLETYAISGLPGSSDVCANGAAAHLIYPGDRIIVAAFGLLGDDEAAAHQPKVVFVDARNQMTEIRPEVAGPKVAHSEVTGSERPRRGVPTGASIESAP
jgi:aspartate 1-decarboxylase